MRQVPGVSLQRKLLLWLLLPQLVLWLSGGFLAWRIALQNGEKGIDQTLTQSVRALARQIKPIGDGLLVDYVRTHQASVVVRGLRAVSDFESELTMAQINSHLLPGMETIFLMTRPEHSCISSSAVREAAAFGADIRDFVPACIAEDVTTHFHRAQK